LLLASGAVIPVVPVKPTAKTPINTTGEKAVFVVPVDCAVVLLLTWLFVPPDAQRSPLGHSSKFA
jgi:hypothetical protein